MFDLLVLDCIVLIQGDEKLSKVSKSIYSLLHFFKSLPRPIAMAHVGLHVISPPDFVCNYKGIKLF